MFSLRDLETITALCRLADAMGLQPEPGQQYKDMLHRAQHAVVVLKPIVAQFDELAKRVSEGAPRIIVPKIEVSNGRS